VLNTNNNPVRHFSLGLFFVTVLAGNARAQSCESSVFARNGAVIELTEYNASNQVNSTQVYTVANVTKTATGVKSSPRSIKKGKDGKVAEDKVYHYTCDAQGMRWGIGVDDTKTKTEAALLYPTTMRPGQDLKTQLEVDKAETTPEGKTARFTLKLFNRKVVGTEKLTVKAGTWSCTKITYDLNMRLKVGLIALPINVKITEWYSPEVGVVRSETYTDGKLAARTDITAIKN